MDDAPGEISHRPGARGRFSKASQHDDAGRRANASSDIDAVSDIDDHVDDHVNDHVNDLAADDDHVDDHVNDDHVDFDDDHDVLGLRITEEGLPRAPG